MKIDERTFNQVLLELRKNALKELNDLLTRTNDIVVIKDIKKLITETENLIGKTKSKELEEVEVNVKVTVSLKKGQDMDKVESAIIKGIYYGLDIRRIANPTDILSIEF